MTGTKTYYHYYYNNASRREIKEEGRNCKTGKDSFFFLYIKKRKNKITWEKK